MKKKPKPYQAISLGKKAPKAVFQTTADIEANPHRSVQTIPEHIRLGILGRRADLIKALSKHGLDPDKLAGCTITEMEEKLEDLS